jgi:tripartite motif-containing protein 71
VGVAVASAGDVYVAGATSYRISKFDSSGTFLRAWGLDVIDDGGGNIGYEICTTASSCKIGRTTSGEGGTIGAPDDVVVGASDNVYVVDRSKDRIQRFDSSGNFIAAFGKDVLVGGSTGYEVCSVAANCQAASTGGLGGEMLNPIELATDSTGNVYVADNGNNRLQKLSGAGAFERAWGKDAVAGGGTGFEVCTVAANCGPAATGELGGEMSAPHGLAVDGDGKVYAGDFANARVQRFGNLGSFEFAWGKGVVAGGGAGAEVCTVAADCQAGSGGDLGGEFLAPTGVAAGSGGALYVVDYRRIDKFTAGGEPPPPANEFEIGKAKLNKRRGTAKVPVDVPGPGELTLKGKGVKRQRLSAGDAGRKILKAIPLVRLRRDLEEDGRERVTLTITFTPVGGEANSESRRLLLRYEPPG